MRRATVLMLLALAQAKLHFSGQRAADGLRDARDNTLVDSLRRQLMHDNYDYMTSASHDLPLPAQRLYDDAPAAHPDDADAPPPPDDGDYFPETPPPRDRPREGPREGPGRHRSASQRRRLRKQPFYEDAPREPSRKPEYQRVESNVPVFNKDLYYYVDDARLNAAPQDALAFNVLDVADAPDQDDFDDEVPAPAPRKKKYTILEMDGGRGARRSGGPSRRRFVQEEGEDGIAIVSLDNGPFPEFRLPTDRRQYMHHEYNDGAANTPPHVPHAPYAPRAPHSQRRDAPLPYHSYERSQQEDDLLYLS